MLDVTMQHRLSGFVLDVSFRASSGVTALFGHSGAGKTTVVQAIAGLLRPDAGTISVDGSVLLDTARGICRPPNRRRIGYVFQDGRLFPHLDVRRNLLYGAGGGSGEFRDRIIAMLGLEALLDRRPSRLSGGEKQRVAIGRALLSDPRLLLLDEPLAALDDARKEEIFPYLERLRDDVGLPIVLVSHSVAEVARLATTVVILEQGRTVASGSAIEIMADPDTVAAFGPRQAGALVEARVMTHHADGLSELETSSGRLLLPRVMVAPGTSLRVRIPAHEVILSRDRPTGLSALNILPAEVRSLRAGGHHSVMVQLACGSDLLLATITARSAAALALAPGVPLYAIIKSVAVPPRGIGTSRPVRPARDAAD